MFRANLVQGILRAARASIPGNPLLRPSIRKEVAAQLKTAPEYKFPTNTLKNPMTEYVDLKENTLCGNQGGHKRAKRLGRGRGSGKGKSCGHGMKGQGHRRNKMYWGFEGGQTPLKKRLPKWGRTKLNRRQLDYVNIAKIIYFLRRNWLSCSPDKYITIKDMNDAGLIKGSKWGVKLLCQGVDRLKSLPHPLFIEVTDTSKNAVEKIKAHGGNVRIRYMTRLKLREHMQPEKFMFPLRDPLPPQSLVLKLEKYRDYGCEVVYNMPEWVKEELGTGREYFQSTPRVPLKELVEATKVRVKKALSRQYKFDL